MAFLFIPALLLLIAYVILIAYYHKGFRQLKYYNSIATKGTTKATVIIAARNEANNIAQCLTAIINQNYTASLLQVIVIDDFSTDTTATIVQSFAPKVQLLQLQNFITQNESKSFKKRAIELGVQHATGELIICTDADCVMTKNWVSNIVSYYETTNAQFIAAPVCLTNNLNLKHQKSNFVETFQTIDFTTLQGITAASVFKNFHTMCNGANLAYTKAAFYKVGGFAGIDNIASGDDMLLMHKIETSFPDQIKYLKSKNAMVHTLTAPNWKSFFAQRIRWSSKASYYNDKKMLHTLMLVYFLNVVTLLQLISLFFAPQNALLVVIFLGVKSIVEYWFLLPILQFYNQTNLKKLFWVCIPFPIVYVVIAGWFGKFGKVQWKQRTI
jgi:cellulose synthase/poly-beta-1,6-N-acetylglucosamine synthase-like glycosyltransferase